MELGAGYVFHLKGSSLAGETSRAAGSSILRPRGARSGKSHVDWARPSRMDRIREIRGARGARLRAFVPISGADDVKDGIAFDWIASAGAGIIAGPGLGG